MPRQALTSSEVTRQRRPSPRPQPGGQSRQATTAPNVDPAATYDRATSAGTRGITSASIEAAEVVQSARAKTIVPIRLGHNTSELLLAPDGQVRQRRRLNRLWPPEGAVASHYRELERLTECQGQWNGRDKSQENKDEEEVNSSEHQHQACRGKQQTDRDQLPVSRDEQLAFRNGTPAIVSEQPSIRNEQPSIRNEQAIIRKEQPAIRNEQPIIKNEQLAVRKEQQTIRKEQPTIRKEQQTIRIEQSIIRNDQLATRKYQNSEHSEHCNNRCQQKDQTEEPEAANREKQQQESRGEQQSTRHETRNSEDRGQTNGCELKDNKDEQLVSTVKQRALQRDKHQAENSRKPQEVTHGMEELANTIDRQVLANGVQKKQDTNIDDQIAAVLAEHRHHQPSPIANGLDKQFSCKLSNKLDMFLSSSACNGTEQQDARGEKKQLQSGSRKQLLPMLEEPPAGLENKLVTSSMDRKGSEWLTVNGGDSKHARLVGSSSGRVERSLPELNVSSEGRPINKFLMFVNNGCSQGENREGMERKSINKLFRRYHLPNRVEGHLKDQLGESGVPSVHQPTEQSFPLAKQCVTNSHQQVIHCVPFSYQDVDHCALPSFPDHQAEHALLSSDLNISVRQTGEEPEGEEGEEGAGPCPSCHQDDEDSPTLVPRHVAMIPAHVTDSPGPVTSGRSEPLGSASGWMTPLPKRILIVRRPAGGHGASKPILCLNNNNNRNNRNNNNNNNNNNKECKENLWVSVREDENMTDRLQANNPSNLSTTHLKADLQSTIQSSNQVYNHLPSGLLSRLEASSQPKFHFNSQFRHLSNLKSNGNAPLQSSMQADGHAPLQTSMQANLQSPHVQPQTRGCQSGKRSELANRLLTIQED